ncbi:hypothetical protein ADILRU_2336 [Leifsonia rubra CMS 76R]|nr:hypothetical protein ADILRU_2336 [Leifsonia rubra CMS 76R]
MALLIGRLPSGWKGEPSAEDGNTAGLRADASIWVTAPDGQRIRLVIEGKKVVDRRDVSQIAERLQTISGPDDVPVLAGRYLSAPVREALTKQGVSYVDATGNMRITSSSPAIYLADRGEDRDPWRGGGRPRGTLKGDPAARVVRTLLDYRQGRRIRDLIETSGTSTGATYRVLDYLQLEGYVYKQGDEYLVDNWELLLRAWSKDSPLFTTNRVAQFLEPRGLEALEKRLRNGPEQRYAATGSFAAQECVQYAPTKAAYLYVPSIESAAEEWNLRPNTTAPNVILIEPKQTNDIVFDNTTQTAKGITVASITQVASDLLNSPGREPAEGEALIEWMQHNENEWRRG